jgi:hypothetical protein
LYFLGDKPKAQAFEQYLAAHPGAIDLWLTRTPTPTTCSMVSPKPIHAPS